MRVRAYVVLNILGDPLMKECLQQRRRAKSSRIVNKEQCYLVTLPNEKSIKSCEYRRTFFCIVRKDQSRTDRGQYHQRVAKTCWVA